MAAWLLALAALAPQFVAATGTGAASAVADSRAATADTLVRALRAGGARVKIEQKIRQPFFPVPATVLEVDNQGVQAYVFRNAQDARQAAAHVSRDGRTVGTAQPFWVGPPHFYRRSNLVVLYLGDDRKMLDLLQSALGPQVAGD